MSSPRSSIDIHLIDGDFPVLTNHERQIMTEFCKDDDLNLLNLMNAIIKVFKQVWNDWDSEGKFTEALNQMNFTEIEGSRIHNPFFSLIVLKMTLKYTNDDTKKDIIKNIKNEWVKFLKWFDLYDE